MKHAIFVAENQPARSMSVFFFDRLGRGEFLARSAGAPVRGLNSGAVELGIRYALRIGRLRDGRHFADHHSGLIGERTKIVELVEKSELTMVFLESPLR